MSGYLDQPYPGYVNLNVTPGHTLFLDDYVPSYFTHPTEVPKKAVNEKCW